MKVTMSRYGSAKVAVRRTTTVCFANSTNGRVSLIKRLSFYLTQTEEDVPLTDFVPGATLCFQVQRSPINSGLIGRSVLNSWSSAGLRFLATKRLPRGTRLESM